MKNKSSVLESAATISLGVDLILNAFQALQSNGHGV
jgi:hypothetical protein